MRASLKLSGDFFFEASMQTRRDFLRSTVAATAAGWTLSAASLAEESTRGELHLAPFRFDATPPKGHPCCGGWITPVEAVDDPLEAIGFVLYGLDKPVVVCSVDWTGILNEAHVQWRTALAEAVGTTLDRVAVHCVHQHNAPLACLEANLIVTAAGDLPQNVDADFFKRSLDQARNAVTGLREKARPVTHIAHGQGKVDKVASNRRIYRNDEGRIIAQRSSKCRDPKIRALPEGTIDPWLKTIAFYDRDTKLAACHYYATHPMSYYGDGRVSSDFAGLARKKRQLDEPECTHLYFTGGGGNIAAGKYNDGSPERRPILTQRVYEGIVRSEANLRPEPVETMSWTTVDFLPPPRDSLVAETLQSMIADKEIRLANRCRPAFMLSWLRRLERKTPIVLSSLHVNDASMLHLPAEPFVQYQLRAQEIGGDRFVATAGYGDGGPWYLPTKEEYPAGGYEVRVAFCDPQVDDLLTAGMKALLGRT